MITKERDENTYFRAATSVLNLRTLDNINARDILKAKKLVVSQSPSPRHGALRRLGVDPRAPRESV